MSGRPDPLLEVRNLRAGYGPAQVLHGLDFSLAQGTITVLLGANGAGKTTTLRAICGMVRTGGEVRFAGERIDRLPTEDIALRGIAHVPEGRGTFSALTTEENLRLGAYTRRDKASLRLDYAGVTGVLEVCSGPQLMDDLLRMHSNTLASTGVTVVRDYAPVEPTLLDKVRVTQILGHLIESACQAMAGVPGDRTLHVAVSGHQRRLSFSVRDSGSGIEADHLSRLFTQGFTTRPDGWGLGLHGCAQGAMEMGARLTVHSDGPGTGATFTLSL